MNLEDILDGVDERSRETLGDIETVLVCQRCSVKDALLAAYRLGKIDGMLEMSGPPKGEKQ